MCLIWNLFFVVLPGNLGILGNKSQNIIVKVLDAHGRFIMTIVEKIEAGVEQLCLNINHLKEGMYIVNTFYGGDFIKAVRFVKN